MSQQSAPERMLECAIRLFRINGIQQTGVDLIIAESGSARATLYSHFGSKSGLVAAALEQEGQQWRDWFFAEIDSRSECPKEQLLGMFDVLANWFRDADYSGCLFMNAVAECRNQDAVIQEATLQHKRAVNRRISKIAKAAGVVHPKKLTQQLDLLMDGLIITALVTQSDSAVKNGRRAAETLLMISLDSELEPTLA